MKTLLLASIAGYVSLVGTGVCPCPQGTLMGPSCASEGVASASPSGLYARSTGRATVWGGACHVSSEVCTVAPMP